MLTARTLRALPGCPRRPLGMWLTYALDWAMCSAQQQPCFQLCSHGRVLAFVLRQLHRAAGAMELRVEFPFLGWIRFCNPHFSWLQRLLLVHLQLLYTRLFSRGRHPAHRQACDRRGSGGQPALQGPLRAVPLLVQSVPQTAVRPHSEATNAKFTPDNT